MQYREAKIHENYISFYSHILVSNGIWFWKQVCWFRESKLLPEIQGSLPPNSVAESLLLSNKFPCCQTPAYCLPRSPNVLCSWILPWASLVPCALTATVILDELLHFITHHLGQTGSQNLQTGFFSCSFLPRWTFQILVSLNLPYFADITEINLCQSWENNCHALLPSWNLSTERKKKRSLDLFLIKSFNFSLFIHKV